MNTITVHCGDIRTVQAAMPDGSVDLIVTSPPFLALRSYLPADHPDKTLEIGSEGTPAAYIDTLLELSAVWRRIVTPTGSICVEIGDTYSGASWGGGDYNTEGLRKANTPKYRGYSGGSLTCNTDHGDTARSLVGAGGPGWPLAKSLCMVPELYGVALAYGINPLTGQQSPAGRWRVRNWLTWTRPNPPVGALGDKFRPATSFVTIACISDKRWFDLDAVRGDADPTVRTVRVGIASASKGVSGGDSGNPDKERATHNPAGAPPLDWWDDGPVPQSFPPLQWHWDGAATTEGTPASLVQIDDDAPDWQPLHRLPTASYAGAHYATYPLALPSKLIQAMCPRAVCVVCGEARRRIVEAEKFVLQGAHWNTHKRDPSKGRLVPASEAMNTTGRRQSDADQKHGVISGGEDQQGFITQTTTIGWTDCDCTPDYHSSTCTSGPNHPGPCHGQHYRPGVVFDPFAGSGTTLLAAAQAGRDAVGVDLDARNLELIRRRIGEALLIVYETTVGDTTTFTVRADMPGTRREADGQQSLFADEAS